MSDELKPCPFCGGKAGLLPDSEHSTAMIVTHYSEGCPADEIWCWHISEEEAVKAWNTRAKPKVKPLEWVPEPLVGWKRGASGGWSGNRCEAIITRTGQGWLFDGKIYECSQDGLEAAKAAAQAGYERRILSPLE